MNIITDQKELMNEIEGLLEEIEEMFSNLCNLQK